MSLRRIYTESSPLLRLRRSRLWYTQIMNKTHSPSRVSSRKSLFEGRINRLAFFLGNAVLVLIPVVTLLAYAAINFIMSSSTQSSSGGLFPEQGAAVSAVNILLFVFLAIYLVMAIFIMFSLYIRRLHDMNLTGWLSILLLINPVSLILYIILQVVEGTDGPNKYGPEERPANLLAILGFRR